MASSSRKYEPPAWRKIVQVLSLVLGIAAIMSCVNPLMAPKSGQTSKGGTILLSIAGNVSRTLLPDIDMNTASYEIKGTGPNNQTFDQTTTGTTKEITGLAAGDWNVTVAALNKEGQNIGIGSSSATVSATTAVSLSITVAPIQGNGTLTLTTTWPASLVQAPSLQASLLPPAGAAIPLTYTMGSGTATLTNNAVPSGYYTLTQSLLDNGVLVMGAVEVVRIVAGQTTSGAFDFSNLNVADPTIGVNITPAMNDPLAVTLNGVTTELTTGSSMTVTAGVTNYTGNVTYVFYLNGVAKASGTSASPSWTFGSDLPVGNYRLDVTAITADGLRAGSATANFSVVTPGTVVLAWNSDTSPLAVGYKLHYGEASGAYTSTLDVAANTAATVVGLLPGHTYYFAVTAYSATGQESGYSNEIAYTVPTS